MCLLIVQWRVDPSYPVIIGANRDERYDRPAISWTMLETEPRQVAGGRDLRAGGTWLALNQDGVVAGLTNRPTINGPDATRRSRGELPLMLVREGRAMDGVDDFLAQVHSEDYNPAWLLVADRDQLFYLEVGAVGVPIARELAAGTYILENAPLDEPSPKATMVRRMLAEVSGTSLWDALPGILSSHETPTAEDFTGVEVSSRVVETYAPCVHTPDYGTRSSAMIRVSPDSALPAEILVADGPPCTTPFLAPAPVR